MELIRKLGTKRIGKKMVRFGIFYCPECKKEVEKSFTHGVRQKHCGCLTPKEFHGESKTKLYQVWRDMKNRCYRPKTTNYHRWGGRGIKVCDEWLNSFLSFRNWAFENGYNDSLQIDRIDPNGNYEPSNCRFIVNARNCRNKVSNKLTWVEVDAIRDLRKTGIRVDKLASLFNISVSMASKLLNGKMWIYKNEDYADC